MRAASGRRSAWVGCVLAGFAAIALAAPVQFRITDVGTLGGDFSQGLAINDLGQVTGISVVEGISPLRAFMCGADDMRSLGTLGGPTSYGYAINNNGAIVGTSFTADVRFRAFVYSGGVMSDLGTPDGHQSEARGINDAGLVTGTLLTPDYRTRAFLRSADGTFVELGSLGGDSEGYAINAWGQVTGDADTETGRHAFLYSDGKMLDLGDLGGGWSEGRAINDRGWVAGGSLTGVSLLDPGTGLVTAEYHAFVHDGTSMKDLGTLGGDFSIALGLNEHGWVVGASAGSAFLHDGQQMFDLNTLVDTGGRDWQLVSATAVNEHGQITGEGVLDGKAHAFVLTPVPEPSTAALVLAGLVAVGAAARRRALRSRRA